MGAACAVACLSMLCSYLACSARRWLVFYMPSLLSPKEGRKGLETMEFHSPRAETETEAHRGERLLEVTS